MSVTLGSATRPALRLEMVQQQQAPLVTRTVTIHDRARGARHTFTVDFTYEVREREHMVPNLETVGADYPDPANRAHWRLVVERYVTVDPVAIRLTSIDADVTDLVRASGVLLSLTKEALRSQMARELAQAH